MPRPRKNADGNTGDILSLLSPARRQAVLEEAIGEQAREIVSRNAGGTLGALVNALRNNSRWSLLSQVPASMVFGGGGGRGGRRRAAAAKAPAGGGRRRRRGISPQVIDRVHGFIQKNPGLRTEELYKRLDMAPDAVKKALSKLREMKKVKTAGEKRATTYSAA